MLSAFRNQDEFIQRSDINLKRHLLSRKADLSCQCQLLPSAPVTSGCQREGKALKNNSKRFTSTKSDFSVQNNVVSVFCSYLCMVFQFHILEMSSIHTRKHTDVLNPSAERSQTGKIALFHRTTAYHCCHSFFRWKLREVFIPSWMILDQRFLESTTPNRW